MTPQRVAALTLVLVTTAACSGSDSDVASTTPVPSDQIAESAGVEIDSDAGSQAQEAAVDGGDVTLQMRTVGPPDAADTVITIHGGPGLSLEAMDGYTPLAGPDRRVVSYDQRGSGRSSVPVDLDYGLAAHVADLEAVRAALNAEKVQLLGQSWGGAIAAAYAATYPDRVSALVLVAAVPLDTEEYLAGQERFQARVNELQQLGVIADDVPPIDEGSCTAAFRAVLPAYLDEPTDKVAVDVASCTADTARATYRSFVNDDTVSDYADALSTFESPTLLITGDNDAFGAGWQERNREILSSAPTDTVQIGDAGHLVIAEQPAATLAETETFLDGSLPTPSD